MTQKQAITAYGTIIKIGGKVSGKNAFALFRLKQQLKEVVEFQAEEEMKLVEKYNGQITENGQIIIDHESRPKFIKEREELGSMECDIQPVEIGEIDITLDEIEALNGFVKFAEVK